MSAHTWVHRPTLSAQFRAGTRRTKRLAALARKAAKRNVAPPRVEWVWLSIKDAADVIGWSQTTMRSRVRDGEFRSRPAASGKGMLVALDAATWPEALTKTSR